ncbi:sodium:solute symporter family transporter [Mesomycoplasma hyorhinis]|uniref:sodium:solute symporter family transporter n=2 Tax=Mesomycoplasma hyorhinis TaxID=2100 RepID=UPI0027E0AD84|nr:sialic acid transporter [Mesomycoplasma hyorhinis]
MLWTDSVQGFILFLGILLILIFGLVNTHWSSPNLKYSFFTKESQWKIDFASGGIFFIFLSKIIENTFTHTASQDIVQRYKTGYNIGSVIKSIYINVILVLVTIIIFYGVGSMLYTYYSSKGYDVDDRTAISTIVQVKNAANNQLLSYFIISVLPIGISGLILSSVFAASQSTISSSLNSLVTTIIVDFWKYFWPKTSDKTLNLYSKILIVVFGAFGFLVAALLIYTKEGNIINYFLSIIGLFAAPVAGTFILGIFTKKTNWKGALSGLICGFAVSLPLWIMTQRFIPRQARINLGPAWITIISFVISLGIGYLSSFLFALDMVDKSIVNLSIWTKTTEFNTLLKLEKEIYKKKKCYKKHNKDKKNLRI